MPPPFFIAVSVLGAESRELLLDELNQHQHSRGGITHVRIKTLDHNNRYKPSHWSRLDDGGETNERLPRGLQDSVRAHHPRAHIIEKGAMLTIVTPASIIPVTSTTVRPLTTTAVERYCLPIWKDSLIWPSFMTVTINSGLL